MGDDNVEVPQNDVGVFIRKVFGGEWLFIRYIKKWYCLEDMQRFKERWNNSKTFECGYLIKLFDMRDNEGRKWAKYGKECIIIYTILAKWIGQERSQRLGFR